MNWGVLENTEIICVYGDNVQEVNTNYIYDIDDDDMYEYDTEGNFVLRGYGNDDAGTVGK